MLKKILILFFFTIVSLSFDFAQDGELGELSNYVFWSLPALAETTVDTAWVRKYNGPGNNYDAAEDIAVDGYGNVYVTGESWSSATSYDWVTIRYYPNGDTAWVRIYNGPGNVVDVGYAVAVDDSGNAYVTGWVDASELSSDYGTMKYDPNGETLWLRRYNGPGNSGDDAFAMVLDRSGNVYVTGRSIGSGSSYDYATIKYYPNGDTAWVRRYNGPGNGEDWASAIVVDDSGYVYVTGRSTGTATSFDYATIKYYPNGDTAWIRRYDGPGNGEDWGRSIALDGSGNVYVTGWSEGSMSSRDYATIKYDPNGIMAWVKRYNGPGNFYDDAWVVAVDNSGNIYVSGRSYGYGTAFDYATIKYYPNGDTAWLRRYLGDPRNLGDEIYGMVLDDLGNVYVSGYSSGSDKTPDFATIKYYPNGDTAWLRRYSEPGGNSFQVAYAMTIDDSNNVYVTGISNDDYATIKYVKFGFLRGDANGDGVINSADVIYLMNYLFTGGPAPQPWQAGDADCDGIINSADVVYLINYLFVGGPTPCS